MEEEIEDEEIKNTDLLIYCSICHKKTFDIITDKSKKNKVLNELTKHVDLSELIKKCNCKNKNNYLYAHKFCVLLKILFNYETNCEICKTDYNIKIKKKFDKKKFIKILLFFLSIYIIHIIVFLLCFFLLFINAILKESFNSSNKLYIYKSIFIFFGVVLLLINCYFLFFTIYITIKQFKINIYNFIIDIVDAEEKNKNNEKNNNNINNNLLKEFQEWAHFQSANYIIYDMYKKFFFNRIYFSYKKEINDFINKNNSDIDDLNIINVMFDNNKDNIALNNLKKNLQINNNINNINNNNNNNPKFLQINNLFHKPNEEINFSSNPSSKLNNENDNSNNNIIIQNNSNSNGNNDFTRKKTKNDIHGSVKLNHTLNDYINININPATSKNINININFSKEKISQIEQFSSSKEFTLRSGRGNFRRNSKIGKTALIPKKLMMTNIITEPNFFKRKRRQLQSIKIKRNKLNLKNTQITGNIDEEIDFSSFEDMGSGISKGIQGKVFSPKGSRHSNFKTKKSFRDVPLNISNSYGEGIGEENIEGNIEGIDISNEQNRKDNIKSNNFNKKVHFAG